jgi:hypothetical protein
VEDPGPVESAPEPQPSGPTSPTPPGIDQFKEMESLVVNVAKFSEQAFEAYEEQEREDELYHLLDAFYEAAAETKKEFRRTTGTGMRGTWSKLRGRGSQGDAAALEIKVHDLTRRAAEVDRLIGSSSATTQDFWNQVRSNLRRLRGYF